MNNDSGKACIQNLCNFNKVPMLSNNLGKSLVARSLVLLDMQTDKILYFLCSLSEDNEDEILNRGSKI